MANNLKTKQTKKLLIWVWEKGGEGQGQKLGVTLVWICVCFIDLILKPYK